MVVNIRKIYAAGIISAAFLLFDRFLRQAAVGNAFGQKDLFFGFFEFSFAKNYGIAFSLPIGGLWLLVLIAAILVILLFVFVLWVDKRDIRSIPLLGIILGAASNLWDRLVYGFVIDYLDLSYFTVFNLADVMIVSSAAILIWLEIKKPSQEGV